MRDFWESEGLVLIIALILLGLLAWGLVEWTA